MASPSHCAFDCSFLLYGWCNSCSCRFLAGPNPHCSFITALNRVSDVRGLAGHWRSAFCIFLSPPLGPSVGWGCSLRPSRSFPISGRWTLPPSDGFLEVGRWLPTFLATAFAWRLLDSALWPLPRPFRYMSDSRRSDLENAQNGCGIFAILFPFIDVPGNQPIGRMQTYSMDKTTPVFLKWKKIPLLKGRIGFMVSTKSANDFNWNFLVALLTLGRIRGIRKGRPWQRKRPLESTHTALVKAKLVLCSNGGADRISEPIATTLMATSGGRFNRQRLVTSPSSACRLARPSDQPNILSVPPLMFSYHWLSPRSLEWRYLD